MALVRLYDFNAANGEHGNSAEYEAAIEAGRKGSTAKSILTYLDHQDRPFDVVVIPKGLTYGQMLTHRDASGPEVLLAREAYKQAFGQAQDDSRTMQIVRPTVFWCPDYKFEYYGDVVGCTQDMSGSMKPKKTVAELAIGEYYYRYYSNMMGRTNKFEVPVVRYTKGFMAPWIVLFHELGHVKQYYEAGGEGGWVVRLANTDGIEADNLLRHENPICKETNIAIRLHYKHMANGMGDINAAFATDKKKPALRVSNSPVERIKMDGELLYSAKYNKLHNQTANAEGYFEKS